MYFISNYKYIRKFEFVYFFTNYESPVSLILIIHFTIPQLFYDKIKHFD